MKKLLSNKILISILLLLLAGNISLIFFMFFPSHTIRIENKSTSYQLRYQSTKEFTHILNNTSKKKFTGIKNLSAINNLKITLEDEDIPDSPPPIGTIPFKITFEEPIKPTSTAIIRVGIDKKDALRFKGDLNILFTQELIRQIIFVAYPSMDIAQKEKIIKNNNQQIIKSKIIPFKLNAYEQ